MSKDIVRKENPLAAISEEKKEMLRNMICKGANDHEMALFLEKCTRAKLDPFLGDIYFFKSQKGPVIGIGINGYRKRAERTGRYAPGRATEYQVSKEGLPVSATAFVKKLTNDGTWHEVSMTVFGMEFQGALKSAMPFHKLGINAESHALRKAFPDEYEGLYSKDELETSSLMNEQELEEEKIKPEHVKEILAMIGDDKEFQNSLEERLGKAFGINSFSELPMSQYESVIKVIKTHNEKRLNEEINQIAQK